MLNGAVLNGDRLNGNEPRIGSGSIVKFSQIVGVTHVGRIARFSQTVVVRITGGGNIVGFEQSVENIQSGLILKFEQVIL
jgi:hypothetical protein